MKKSLLSSEQLLKQENQQLKDKVLYLEEQLSWFQKQIFGKKSEKEIKDLSENEIELPLFGFDNPETKEEVSEVTVPAHIRKKNRNKGQDKISYPDNLPVESIVLDLSEKEKVCPETNEPLLKIGEEKSQKLAYRPGQYFIKEIIRPKYAFPKNSSKDGIVTKDLPGSFIAKTRIDESLLADILTKKFGDHLPLYRISEIFERDKIYISRQVMSQWVLKSGELLTPLRDLMQKKILENKNAFIDESPLKMQDKSKKELHQGYMWLLVGGEEDRPLYKAFFYHLDRKHMHAEKILLNFKGVLHSDKYGAYENLANEKIFTWAPCWVHIRRKFIEAESGDPKLRKIILRKIRHLFIFERIGWTKSAEERLKIRQEKEIPIIDDLIKIIKDAFYNKKILPKSKFKTALNYFCGLIPHLKNYTKHPFSRIDNNVAERAIRPLAISRKNWLFVGNEKGGQAAAVLLSLIQTCRGLGINPREYLEDVMRRIMDHNNKKLYELLPDNWQKNKLNNTS